MRIKLSIQCNCKRRTTSRSSDILYKRRIDSDIKRRTYLIPKPILNTGQYSITRPTSVFFVSNKDIIGIFFTIKSFRDIGRKTRCIDKEGVQLRCQLK